MRHVDNSRLNLIASVVYLPTPAMQEGHRSGPLKQANKAHKSGRHRSKGAVDAANKGRVGAAPGGGAGGASRRAALSRAARKCQVAQRRARKRDEAAARKRRLGGFVGTEDQGRRFFPPVLCAVVQLHSQDPECARALLDTLRSCSPDVAATRSVGSRLHLSFPRFKCRYSFLTPDPASEHDVLDACKACDAAVFLLSAQEGFGAEQERALAAVLAQGLPADPVFVVTDLDALPAKRQGDAKRDLLKALNRRFSGADKILTCKSEQEGLLFLRALSNQRLRANSLRDRRAHMVAEEVEFEESGDAANAGTLKVTGYVRGQDLSANRLVHIPGVGSFQVDRIESPGIDPHPLDPKKTKRHSKAGGDSEMSDAEVKVLARADPAKQEGLESECEPDMFDGEQYLSPDDEAAAAASSAGGAASVLSEKELKEKKVLRVPKGTSDYQASWIFDAEEVEGDEDGEDEDEDDFDDSEDENMIDAESQEDSDEGEDEEDDEEYETMTIASEATQNDENYDEKHVNFAEEQEELKKLKEARMDAMFPDEIDTPIDQVARIRFQKYRGLKSFRTSPWDPKENLPSDYARIFQFENFNRTKKRVLGEELEDSVPMGSYVSVFLKDVPRYQVARFLEDDEGKESASRPAMILYSMLPHENKMSVLNFVVKRSSLGPQHAVKAKERLVFHCGFRRFAACPVFSQHTNGGKHKHERFWREGATVVMTVFAPIMFPPAGVLVYQEQSGGAQPLVGTGTLLSVDPDRLVVKRAVLSGHPFKIRKRATTVRFMFFNREDIAWFKPVELRSKYGRRGHIKEPLGTHGHMKCVFDKQLTQQDTVLMNLYKRVFPKWTYDPFVPAPLAEPEVMEEESEETLQLPKKTKKPKTILKSVQAMET